MSEYAYTLSAIVRQDSGKVRAAACVVKDWYPLSSMAVKKNRSLSLSHKTRLFVTANLIASIRKLSACKSKGKAISK